MKIIDNAHQEKNKNEVKTLTKSYNRFSQKLNELKEFSDDLPAQSELPSVPQTGGLFGLFDYDVKGSDLNKLTENIQEKMITQNKVLVRTIKEFRNIYETFTLLDKEYIHAILNSIQAAEEANRKAILGLEGVEKHQSIIKKNQEDIQDIIDQQQIVIQVLRSHKEKLETLKHLEDIDAIYSGLSNIKIHFQEIITKQNKQETELGELHEAIHLVMSSQNTLHDRLIKINETLDHETEQLNKQLLTQEEVLTTLKTSNAEHQNNIEKLQHDHCSMKDQFMKLQEEIQTYFHSINLKLNNHVQMLEKSISFKKDRIEEIDKKFETQLQRLASDVEKEKKEVISYLNSELLKQQKVLQDQNVTIEKLSTELKSAKISSYISIGMFVVLVILMISGVL